MSAGYYYTESLAEAFCAIDKWDLWDSLSEAEQQELGAALAGSAENYSTYAGYDCISDPRDTEIDRLKAKHKEEIAALEARADAWRAGIARHVRVDEHRLVLNHGQIEVTRN